MTKGNACIYWGENRKDELHLDVGCVLGHAFCPASSHCQDYKEVEKK